MKIHLIRVSLLSLLVGGVYALASSQADKAPTEKPVKIADGVWFEQHHDIGKFGSNISWIEFSDYVVVIDTSFPLGAEEAIRNIKATTNGKPIRYAIVTHYHADHTLGAGAFAKEGTTIIAHENARKEFLARNVEGYLKTAERDPVYAKYQPTAPQLTFTDKFIIDDGKRRAEVYYFGQAHTTGCIFTFLPKERIVFTGDACVNGPFNYCGDSDTASWIDVLTNVQTLDAETVVPAHGPVAKRELLQTQKQYFLELRAQVAAALREGKTLDQAKESVDVPMWREWTGEKKMSAENISHVYRELSRGALNWSTGDLNQPGRAPAAIGAEELKGLAKLKFLSAALSPEDAAAVAQVAPNVEILVARTKEEALALAPQVHGCAGSFVTPEFLAAAKNLRWVQQFSAGVEQITFLPELQNNDRIVLTNMRTLFAPPIADHVMGMLLSLSRSLPHYEELMKSGTWGKGDQAPYQGELLGKTMLVVGLGGNGMETAKRARGFGMRVLATDPKDMAVPVYVDRLEKPDRLNALLPAADVVVLAAPLTPDTTALFGTDRFALLKEGAFFINIARGRMVDTGALVAALQSKRVRGAGLDVTDPEPLPPDHALWKMGNVIVTPHVSGQSPGTRLRTRSLFLENLKRFAVGEPLINVVDKKAGY
ncbi:MAG TPA: NAD(P)-dependent oxidoreductase [Planctomycetota bacterium]|nr:NAD(P)-dependent oxidoreductase [Planctomycetota bacterium]